ncbi:hypothetical protein PVAP13_4NG198700 [Panicum virgatum]|uniref:Vesicle transport protein n=1 Tax=Panicum virgatum TaxID=38727 RepID=A0A8T0TEY8_PANVG|nr:hypothetical protein PVAP13_4NG198700 [Panicum virgatum]
MQWFSSGSGPSSSAAASSSQPSLLADWNSYAAARSAEDAGDGFGIDIEAAVRSANDRVAGTFGVVSKVMVIMPQKFAICFTAGCAFIIGSFFALKGPKNQLYHMISKERLPFTVGFVGSMVATIYVSMVMHSYILSVFFSVLQVLALAYYTISYFPGGSAGMKFLSSTLVSSVLRCFGR